MDTIISCKLSDVRYVTTWHEFRTVDGSGEAGTLTEKSRGLRHYHCKAYQGKFDIWDEVTRHLQPALGGEVAA